MRRRLNDAIVALIEGHALEMEARRLEVRRELDSGWQVETNPALEVALRELLRLVFATVPDGCEIYVGSARSTAAVARLSSGELVLRWQVAGSRGPDQTPGLTPLHPRAGDAVDHARSRRATRVRAAFAEAGWTFVLEGVGPRSELVARARIDSLE